MVDIIVQNVSVTGFTDLTFTIGRTDYKKALQITSMAAKDVGAEQGRWGRQDRQSLHRRHGDALPLRRGPEGVRDARGGGDQHPGNLHLEIKISVLIEEKYTELAVRVLHGAFGLGNPADGGASNEEDEIGRAGRRMKTVYLYDTTLRDGTQSEEVSPVRARQDRDRRELDEFGIHYIEGGYPGSNPKDKEFFERARKMRWKNSVMCAFGMTRRVGKKVDEDANMKALVAAGTPVITVVGKSWDFHVIEALRTTLEENLHAVKDTVAYLKKNADKVFFDAEHFFDGYRHNPKYAMKVLAAAVDAGPTSWSCATRTAARSRPTSPDRKEESGRRPPRRSGSIPTTTARWRWPTPWRPWRAAPPRYRGRSTGTGNGAGTRTCAPSSPALELKMGREVLPKGQPKKPTDLSRYVAEVANVGQWLHQPYVGNAAFAHKGGCTSPPSAGIPEDVRAHRARDGGKPSAGPDLRPLRAQQHPPKIQEKGLKFKANDPNTEKDPRQIKELEHKGFQFEGADASFELLARRAMGEHEPFSN